MGAADDTVDVVIVGAGMVGAAVAALLRHNPLTSGLRVAVLDRAPPLLDLDTAQYPDLRVSTITPASIEAISRAGAWAGIAPPRSAEFRDMQVWDFGGPGHVRWSASEVGAPRMGVVVENRLLQAALLRAATAASAPGRPAEIVAPAAVEALRLPDDPEAAAPSGSCPESGPRVGMGPSWRSNEPAELALACGRRLRARLVVGADGAASRVRDLAGLRTVGWPYHQSGLVATVATSEPNSAAWQRFLPDGPLALLPVRGGYSNIVWTTTPEGARRLEAMSSDQFADAANAALHGSPEQQQQQQQQQQQPLAALATALSGALEAGAGVAGALGLGSLGGGDGRTDGSVPRGAPAFRPPPLVLGYVGARPASFPLQMRHSGRYVLPRLALVGDAAHAVHPLAGQGVNLGLGDAAALAGAIAAAREVGADIGDAAALRRDYEGPRRRANLTMSAALESLQRLFCAGGGLLGAARAAGLGAVNAAPPVKERLMRYAMGLA